MVNYWDAQRERAIKITKFRIKHHEFHGNGDIAMHEKQILKKQERALQLIKDKRK